MEPFTPKSGDAAARPPAAPASQTLTRGLDVLEEVAAGPVALNVIASRLKLSRSTVHRLATSLIERRYLTLAPRHGYSLGPKLLELGSRARGQIGLVRAARPFMEALADATGDAVFLAVRDSEAAMIADSVPGARRLAPRLRVGERLDLHRHAAGRALLMDLDQPALSALAARLPESRCAAFLGMMRSAAASGLALDDEPDAEIVSMACAVRGADGTVRGALGLALAATYKGIGLAASAREALCQAADALSQELGWRITAMRDDAAADAAERELLGTPGKPGSRSGGPAGAAGSPSSGSRLSRQAATRAEQDAADGEGQGRKARVGVRA